MPEAHAILWFLGAFLGFWGLSLIIRGLWGDRRGARRCPTCRTAIADQTSLICPACGYEARRERDVRAAVRHWPLAAAGFIASLAGAGAIYAGAAVYIWTHQNPDFTMWVTLWDSIGLGLFSFSVLLIAWAIRGERSRGRRRCPGCWYDMAGVDMLRCPECGRESKHAREFYRPRRRWRWAAAGAIGLLLAAGVTEWPRYQRGGVTAMVPTTVLIAGLGWLPDSMILQSQGRAPEDWSLLHRSERSSLWAWQGRWLAQRAAAIVQNPRSPEELRRAASFYAREIYSGTAGSDPSGAFRATARWLTGDDRDLRSRAAQCLHDVAWIWPPMEVDEQLTPFVPRLNAALEDPNRGVRLMAAFLLAHAPGDQRPAARCVMQLARTAARPDQYLCAATLSVLARRTNEESARVLLLDWSRSADPAERLIAASALRDLVAGDAEVTLALRARLNDPDDRVALTAAGALCRAGIPLARELLDSACARTNPRSRSGLVSLLQVCPPADTALAVPGLASLLTTESDPAVLAMAAQTLEGAARQGVDIAAALPVLSRLSKSADPTVSQAAAGAVSADEARRSTNQSPPTPVPAAPLPPPPSPP